MDIVVSVCDRYTIVLLKISNQLQVKRKRIKEPVDEKGEGGLCCLQGVIKRRGIIKFSVAAGYCFTFIFFVSCERGCVKYECISK